MVKASDIKPMWTPKTPPVPKQCKTCPFGPNAHKLEDSNEAIASAKHSADMGLDFHCHQTVYAAAFTNKPLMRPRSQWKTCAGAVAYKQNREVDMRKQMLRDQGRLIED